MRHKNANSPEQQIRDVIGKMAVDADTANKWDLTADLYEFKIALRREDEEWKVSFAQWLRSPR